MRGERDARYRAKRQSQHRAYNNQYSKDHPEKTAEWVHRRRARRLNNGGDFISREWQDLKAKYDYTCLSCRTREPEISLTADHVVPLSKGGSNNISNIQPLCGRCNSLKYDKSVDFRRLM